MSDREPVVLNGRYELHSRIARGGMAEVYLARDQLLDRPVAIKVLFPEFAVDPAFVERFRREAQSAANLNHPAIVGVYDWGAHDSTYFIVMEYVRGRSLADILRAEGTLHPDRAADIATDIAGALYFAHRNGVVHRDVKPGNVLISPQGQVKVTDFGIARAVGGTTAENLTQTGSVMGTATYFSPEQAQGLAVDPRSDLYSLGVVLYEMLVGRPPFAGDSPVTIAYKHVQESPAPLRQVNPAVPAELEAICLKLLAKNPVNRYASAEELRSDLRRYREGQPVRAERVLDPGAVAATRAVPGLAPAAATPAAMGLGGAPPTQAMAGLTRVNPYGQLRSGDGTAVQPYTEAPQPYEPPRRNGMFIGVLVVLLAVLGALLIALLQVLNNDEAAPETPLVDVPDVTLLSQAEAEAELRRWGFDINVVPQRNDTVPAGQVVRQEPRAGIRAEQGSTVTLYVSAPDAQLPVPGVVGDALATARQKFQSAGFDLSQLNVTARDSDKPVDEVIEQNPPAGTTVTRGDLISLVVSKGPQAVALPSVTGRSCDDARRELVRAGVREDRVSCVDTPNDQVPAGQVIGTDPQGSAAPNQDVRILVSSGPAQVRVPEVVNLTQAAAEQALTNAGLSPRVAFEERSDRPAGVVVRQNPEGGGQANAGSTVTITVAQAPATTTTERATTTTNPTTTNPTTSNGGGGQATPPQGGN